MRQDTQPAPSVTAYASWLDALLLCIVCAAACLWLWPKGMAGNDYASAGAALLFAIAVAKLNAAIGLRDHARALAGVRAQVARPQEQHGTARWAVWNDLKRAGMHKVGGMFLGTFGGKPIFQAGDGSTLVVAGPGQKKTVGIVMPFLLECKSGAVVIDISREILSVTARSLEQRLFRLWVLSPWDSEFCEEFGGDVEPRDDGFDPCSFLEIERNSIIDDVGLLASLLLPVNDGGGGDDTSDFFRKYGQDILSAFMLFLLDRDGHVTLPILRRAVFAPTAELEASIESMERSEAFSGTLAELAARMAGTYVNAPKEWSGGLSAAMEALRPYDTHGALGRHVSKGGVDFRRFKDKPTVAFIVMGAEKVDGPQAAWLAMVTKLSMEMIARHRTSTVPVHFIVDEVQNLPKMDTLFRGIALYRKFGLRFVFLAQFLAALRRKYGDSYREFLGCDVVCAYGPTNDAESLRLFSELAGQQSIRTEGFSAQPDKANSLELGMSTTTSHQGRSLIFADEVRRLDMDAALIFAQNLPPILAQKRSYLDVPRLRRRADPNPYYRRARKSWVFPWRRR